MPRRYFIETFGCQMNYHDAERLAGLLEADGFEATSDEQAADLVVINTCSVRERAEEKLYTRLGELRVAHADRSRPPLVAVTGCVAQQEGERLLRRDSSIDIILGTQSLKSLPRLVREAESRRGLHIDIDPHQDVSFPIGVARHSDPVRAWVTIIEGCNEFCSFCVVPYTRGHERMRPVSEILADVARATAAGRSEIQLLGQIVNHYQAPDDPRCDFATLLERVHDVPGVRRIRFASPHPRHVDRALMAALRDLPKLCKHLHLPVQSGSNRVLKAMRRRYTREEYIELAEALRQEVPGISLSTDMIVGFPGETPADLDLTLDLMRRVRFQSMFSFKYSPRPQTLAMKRLPDDVTEAEKTRRILAVQDLQRQHQTEWFARSVGSTVEVLADGISRRRDSELAGRTSGNAVVNFPGTADQIGRLLSVRITAYGPNSLRGELVPAEAGEVIHAG